MGKVKYEIEGKVKPDSKKNKIPDAGMQIKVKYQTEV
jgi:hypothetical protein